MTQTVFQPYAEFRVGGQHPTGGGGDQQPADRIARPVPGDHQADRGDRQERDNLAKIGEHALMGDQRERDHRDGEQQHQDGQPRHGRR
jgi:hypothetical protein